MPPPEQLARQRLQRLRHANVVAHLDVFEIDADSFCTILELCKGPDLEHVLRAGPLPERVAKSVVRQVMSALRYVSAPPRRIIHYDLKPANVLFDEAGTAKISDFGLSKEMDGDVAPTANGIVSVPGTSSLSTFAASAMPSRIELTSVGVGTYWYLPPECFPGTGELAAGTAPPQISSKVDDCFLTRRKKKQHKPLKTTKRARWSSFCSQTSSCPRTKRARRA